MVQMESGLGPQELQYLRLQWTQDRLSLATVLSKDIQWDLSHPRCEYMLDFIMLAHRHMLLTHSQIIEVLKALETAKSLKHIP